MLMPRPGWAGHHRCMRPGYPLGATGACGPRGQRTPPAGVADGASHHRGCHVVTAAVVVAGVPVGVMTVTAMRAAMAAAIVVAGVS